MMTRNLHRSLSFLCLTFALGCTEGGEGLPQFLSSSEETPNAEIMPAVNEELARRAGLEQIVFLIGPARLPAKTSPDASLEKPLVLRLQLDAPKWIIGFASKLVDPLGNELPSALLHHSLLLNMREANPLCTSGASGNPFAAATSLMTPVHLPEGYGYPLLPTDPIEARIVLHNPTDRDYPEVFYEVTLFAKPMNELTALKDVKPLFIDPEPCRHALEAIPPEPFYEQTVTASLTRGGDLVLALGLMQNYAASLSLTKKGKVEPLWTMTAKIDEHHMLEELLNNPFEDPAGLAIADGETLLLRMLYDNTSGRWLSDTFSGALLYLTEKEE